MVSKALLIAVAIAYVEARFGQENVPIAAISAVNSDGGEAATIAGAAISDLLGGADACAKLQRADEIVETLGGGADAIEAAKGLVAAEKNTNPFANGNVQNVCNDPSLPATAELRGITPLIDPDVDAGGDAAALSASSLANPLNADGMSVFDLMDQAGLGDLVSAQGAGGAGGAAAGNNNAAAGNNNAAAGNNNAAAGNNNAAAGDNNAAAGNNNAATGNNNNNNQQAQNGQNAGNNNAGNNNAGNANAGNNANNNAGNANAGNNANNNAGNANAGNNANNNAGNANNNAGNNANDNADNANNNAGNANNNNNNAAAGGAAGNAATAGGEDFGDCTPTIFFQGGLNGRPADEFTFQITDETARGGQGEALNPNIITNALCNQLTNVCNANDAAVAKCEDAAAQVEAAGTRDQTTADLFNEAIGFAGAAKRAMRRGYRA